jgi:hypothetical protein
VAAALMLAAVVFGAELYVWFNYTFFGPKFDVGARRLT